MYEVLVYGLGASSTDIHFERHMPEVRGRLDALLGQTVLEFKRDLRRERPRRRGGARGATCRSARLETGERFIGIATDGAEFIPYEIEDGQFGGAAEFQAVAGRSAQRSDLARRRGFAAAEPDTRSRYGGDRAWARQPRQSPCAGGAARAVDGGPRPFPRLN